MNRGRLPALVGGGGSSVVGKRETRLYEPEERLHSFRRGVKTELFVVLAGMQVNESHPLASFKISEGVSPY
jgi:hypothetical protein